MNSLHRTLNSVRRYIGLDSVLEQKMSEARTIYNIRTVEMKTKVEKLSARCKQINLDVNMLTQKQATLPKEIPRIESAYLRVDNDDYAGINFVDPNLICRYNEEGSLPPRLVSVTPSLLTPRVHNDEQHSYTEFGNRYEPHAHHQQERITDGLRKQNHCHENKEDKL